MSPIERIIHQQQFQNAQQTVEVIVKAKPKARYTLKTKSKSKPATQFIRNCILKKELESLALEEEKKIHLKDLNIKTMNTVPDGVTNIEISKKGVDKQADMKDSFDSATHNMTWKERLDHYSIASCSNSKSSTSVSTIDQEDKLISRNNSSRRTKIKNHRKTNKPVASQIASSNIQLESHYSQNRPLYIDASIQTSLQGGEKMTFETKTPSTHCMNEDHVSIKNQVQSSQVRTSSNQTDSPFGESVLQLLHQLRERLRSKADSEGCHIVNAIEACFGTRSKCENKEVPPISEKLNLSNFFTFNDLPQSTAAFSRKDDITEELKRVVVEQEQKLKERERVIQELRSLSDKLLAYHELYTHETSQQIKKDQKKGEDSSGGRSKGEDSGIEMDSRNLQKVVNSLAMERDAFLKEVKHQREIILNLEVKLHQLTTKMAGEDKSVKIQSNANDIYSERPREENVGLKQDPPAAKVPLLSTQCPRRRPPVESEVDSAFEEKSSRSASNLQSPAGPPKRIYPRAWESHEASSIPQRAILEATSRPSESAAGILPHEMLGWGDLKTPTSLKSYCLSFVSDVSDAHSDILQSRQEGRAERQFVKSGIHFSETPIVDIPPSHYLESTRIRDGSQRPEGSSQQVSQKRPHFDVHISSESSSKAETVSLLVPQSLSTDSDLETEPSNNDACSY